MRIRIKFRKYGPMKFIGHLDMMRYFQKAMRRADIDICYSEGYSPHQIMSFAAPLGVGITSDGEYLDIEVHSSMSTKEALQRINDTMVYGVEVTEYVELEQNAKKAMTMVASAEYDVFYKEGYESPKIVDEWASIIEDNFWKKEEFIITKKTKKSEREVDLKPLVEKFSVLEKDGRPCFNLQVSTGSVNNIKPELVLESVFKTVDVEFAKEAFQIHRVDVFAYDNSENLVPLGAFGKEIQ